MSVALGPTTKCTGSVTIADSGFNFKKDLVGTVGTVGFGIISSMLAMAAGFGILLDDTITALIAAKIQPDVPGVVEAAGTVAVLDQRRKCMKWSFCQIQLCSSFLLFAGSPLQVANTDG